MIHLHTVIFCLAVASQALSQVKAQADCSADGFKCDSCSTLVLCSGGSVSNTFPCQSTEMCEEGTSGIGSCVLTSATTRTQCQCQTFPSFVVDSYDPTKYILCFASTLQLALSCPSGEEFDQATNQCVTSPTTTSTTSTTTSTTTEPTVTCTEDGVFPLLPSCSGYYGCYNIGGMMMSTGIVYCEAPKVFNPDTLTCVDSITAPSAPTCGTNDIVAADTVECNAFYVCNGGNTLGEKICCGEGQVFNSATSKCEADSGIVTCPTDNPCYTEEIVKKCIPPTC